MAVFCRYLVKNYLSSVGYYKRVDLKSCIFQGTRNTRPCLTGHPVKHELCFSLKNPAKFIGKKPRKYTVPVPIKAETPGSIGGRGGPGGGPAARSSGRVRGQGVEPIAAQAAAAAQVRTYRDNGIKHSSSAYNRVCSLLLTIQTNGNGQSFIKFHKYFISNHFYVHF